MILLDSNTIIYLSKELISLEDVFVEQEDRYAISIITYMEVLGFQFESKKEEEFIIKLLDHFEKIYIDENISNKVIELRKIYQIKLPDAIICASALVNGALLVTNDIRLKNISSLNLKLLNV